MMTMFDIEATGPGIMSCNKVKSVTRQRKPRGRKFYLMSYDYTKGGAQGYSLENILSLAPDRKGLESPRGRRGFRDYPEAPCFLFDKKVGRLPQDVEGFDDYWLVSDRAKSVFEAADPAGVAFLPCDVRLPHGDYDGPRYWLCDVLRVLDALDEARSRLKIGIRDDERYADFGRKYYSVPIDLVFRDDAIGDAHVFRMAHMRGTIICDQTMKDACKVAGLKGIRFVDASKR